MSRIPRRAPLGARRRDRQRAIACCPACAASVAARRPSRSEPSWRWLILFAAVVAGLPAAVVTAPPTADAAHAALPGARSLGDFFSELPPLALGPARGEEPVRIEDHGTQALGGPNGGSLSGGVELPAAGPGFYTYDPRLQAGPNASERRWGTPEMVRELIALGRWWTATHPRAPRLGIGDLSLRGGGPIDGHASHQNGLDVDIRLPRADGREGRADPASYDRGLTQALVDRLAARGAELILVGPSLDLSGPVTVWPNHDDHLHVRLVNPG